MRHGARRAQDIGATTAWKAVFIVMALAAVTCSAAESLSIEDVRGEFTKGNYAAVVEKTNKMLFGFSNDPSSSQEYELLMLRGESQLQLKDRIGGSNSFKSAAKVAADVNQYAAARANALILDRSSMGKYNPRAGSGKDPIDILSMDSRKEAMRTLQADLWSQNKSQIEAALKATSLPAIEKGFAPLSDMYLLETAADPKANETEKMMRDLGQHTYRLLQTDVIKYSRRISQLDQLANSSAGDVGNWGDVRRGLHSPERNEVKAIGATLIKIRDRAVEYRGIANKLGGNEQRWDAMVLNITDTLATAESLYNDR